MIRPLRRAHRLTFVTLAVAVPVLLAAAMGERGAALLEEPPQSPQSYLGGDAFVADFPVDGSRTGQRVRLDFTLAEEDSAQLFELWAIAPLVVPDLLAYRVPKDGGWETAYLLGTLRADGARVKMDDLIGRMHAGIGSTGTHQCHGFIGDAGKGLFQMRLHEGDPSAVVNAVIVGQHVRPGRAVFGDVQRREVVVPFQAHKDLVETFRADLPVCASFQAGSSGCRIWLTLSRT